jgi:polysaccharide biosynthesis transport protein
MDNNLDKPMFPNSQLAEAPQHLVPQRESFNQYYIESSEIDRIRDLWYKLLSRKKLILAVFITIVAATGLYVIFKQPVYRSTATLQIMQNQSILGERDPAALLGMDDSANKFYETQYMILNSRTMASNLIAALNLKDHQEFKEIKEHYSGESPQEIEYRYIKFFLKNLDVKPIRKSYLVEVSYKSTDKKLAQDVANAVYLEYTRFAMQTRQQSFGMIKEWLEGQLNQLAVKVEDSEKKLFEHGKQKDFYSLEGKDNVIVSKYIELSMLLTRAESDRRVKEAQFKQIKEHGVDAPLITNNPLIQKIREEAISQEAKFASLNKIYDTNFPQLQADQAKLRDLKLRLKNEVKRTRDSIEADYQASLKAENLIRSSLEAQKAHVGDLQNNLIYHHNLKRDLQANEQLYQGLLARMKEASVASTMVASNVAVIAPGEVPVKRDSPKPLLYLGVASILGLLGGIGIAMLLDHVDDSIKTVAEMEQFCQIPLLAMVPNLSLDSEDNHKEKSSELVMLEHPRSHMAESIHHLRSSIMLSAPGGAPPIIMVTSPNPAEGKTTISLNLAVSLALNHTKTLIIDADMRKPSVHKAFHKPNQPGLSNLLTGNATLEEVVHSTPLSDLYFIPAGSLPPNPIEILLSQGIRDLLNRLHAEYSFIVIDTPPIVGFADARIISSLVNAVVLVISHNKTSRKAGHMAAQMLFSGNAKILGGVLNMSQNDSLRYEGYLHKSYKDYYLNNAAE